MLRSLLSSGAPLLLLLLLLVVTMPTQPADAWGHDGHRIVAQLAQNSLSSTAWNAIQPYLPPGATGLPDIATQPDSYAQSTNGGWSLCLHYGNVNQTAVTFNSDHDCPGNCCVTKAIANYTSILMHNQSAHSFQSAQSITGLLHDPNSVLHQAAMLSSATGIDLDLSSVPADAYSYIWRGVAKPSNYYELSAEERIAVSQLSSDYVPEPSSLSFLVHFVGDCHQPLHVSYGCDQGGNFVNVSIFEQDTELHFVWDSVMLDHYDPSWSSFADDLQSYLDRHEHLYTEYTKNMSPEAWANESLNYTRYDAYNFFLKSDYYPGYPGSTCPYPYWANLEDDYYDANIDTIKKRLSQGGVRLGHLLNTIFDPSYAAKH